MQPRTAYIICATQRSGSTLLCETLRATGIAGCPEEYFDALKSTGVPRRPLEYFSRVEDDALCAIFRASSTPDEELRQPPPGMSYNDYIEWAIEKSTTPNGVCGTKLMWGYFPDFISKVRDLPAYKELSAPEILASLFPNPRYIYVTRDDKLSQAISLWKALQTWTWRQEDIVNTTSKQKKELAFHFGAIDHLIQIFEGYEQGWQDFFAVNHLFPLTVTYNELITSYEATIRSVFDYLDIYLPPDLVVKRPRMERQADALSADWTQQYHAIKKLQRGSAEHMS